MIKAAEYSANNYFVQLEFDADMYNVVQMAEKVGVTSNTADAPIRSSGDKPSFTHRRRQGDRPAGADLWRPTMDKYLKNRPRQDFVPAPDSSARS